MLWYMLVSMCKLKTYNQFRRVCCANRYLGVGIA